MVSEGLPSELPTELASGRFRALSVLGRGASALTFVAEDRERGGRVAIKRFQVHGAPSWKQVELAEREARVLSTLSHPNLPAYITHFEQGGALYLVMELVEGKTLGELKREGALEQRDVVDFLKSAAKTLDYLHGRAPPIVHRDVKPNNFIRRPDGSFVLVDFGSVRDKLRPEGGSTVVGTFGYMAPEQFQGRALPVTDTYGLGATALACLTGEEPENLPHRGLAIDVRRALAGRAEPRLIALFERMLEPDPERRPADLGRALAALDTPGAEPFPERDPRSSLPATRQEVRRTLRELKRQRKRLRRAERERVRIAREIARMPAIYLRHPWRWGIISSIVMVGLFVAMERGLAPPWLTVVGAIFLAVIRTRTLAKARAEQRLRIKAEAEAEAEAEPEQGLDKNAERQDAESAEDELSDHDHAVPERRARR